MAVPANPKLSQVIAEFETPANTKLSQFLRNGAYVMDSPANAGVPTTLPIRLSQLAGATKAPPPPRVNVRGGEVYAAATANLGTKAHYELTIGGVEQTITNLQGTVVIGNWVLSGVASDYHVKATVIADNGLAFWSGAAPDQWLDFSVTRRWTYGDAIMGEIGQSTLRIDVRDALTGLPVDDGPAYMYFESERIET